MSSAATYIGRDDATRGNWFDPSGPTFVYGQDGFQVPSASSLSGSFTPSYVSGFSVDGSPSDAMFIDHSSDVVCLLKFPGGDPDDRYYPLWYKPDFDLSFTTSQATRLGVYNRDNDVGRVQTIAILDGGTDAVLDSRTIEGFGGGAWLVWDLTPGDYKVRGTSDTAAIICGLFWGPSGSGVGVDPLGVSLASSSITSTTATVTATPTGGTGAVTYAWTQDGSPLPGQTGAVLDLTDLTPSTTYEIGCTAADSATTATATTTFTTAPAPAPSNRVIRVEPHHAKILWTGVDPYAAVVIAR